MKPAVVAAYAALMAAWVYGVLNTDRTDVSSPDRFWESPLWLVPLAAIHVALGLALGRWWAPAVLVLPVVLAIPAGYEPDGYPELPISLYLALQLAMFGTPLVLAGVLARALAARYAGGTRGASPLA